MTSASGLRRLLGERSGFACTLLLVGTTPLCVLAYGESARLLLPPLHSGI